MCAGYANECQDEQDFITTKNAALNQDGTVVNLFI